MDLNKRFNPCLRSDVDVLKDETTEQIRRMAKTADLSTAFNIPYQDVKAKIKGMMLAGASFDPALEYIGGQLAQGVPLDKINWR